MENERTPKDRILEKASETAKMASRELLTVDVIDGVLEYLNEQEGAILSISRDVNQRLEILENKVKELIDKKSSIIIPK